ncbi:hypothetical protein [Methylibium rhizosphaerae]|uniref:hypothetical protein n=1 Tax=Methylibium rhizosphaerae TaxID=2570323 RepID=UPI001128C4D6|nr:hypothetical protein [Methylibium rhizosphaerae]
MYLLIGLLILLPLGFVGMRMERHAKSELQFEELERLQAQRWKMALLGSAFGGGAPLAAFFAPDHLSWSVFLPLGLVYAAASFYIVSQARLPNAYMKAHKKGLGVFFLAIGLFSVAAFLQEENNAQIRSKLEPATCEPSASPNPSIEQTANGGWQLRASAAVVAPVSAAHVER